MRALLSWKYKTVWSVRAKKKRLDNVGALFLLALVRSALLCDEPDFVGDTAVEDGIQV